MGKMPTIIRRLRRRYGSEMHTSLSHGSAWELLVATMLSAQSQDAQVNKATPALFRRFPKAADYVGLKPRDLYPYVKGLGLYRNKSKNIIGAARYLHEHFGGRVPTSIGELTQLPGVGRKTANVVLANAFGILEGIAIDTHCITVSRRLFLVRTSDPSKIEKYMMENVPRKEWGNITHLLIALGRDACTARKAYCTRCVLSDICPSSNVKYERR